MPDPPALPWTARGSSSNSFIVRRQKLLLSFLQCGERLFPIDGREVVQELVERMSVREVVEECLHRHAGPAEAGVPLRISGLLRTTLSTRRFYAELFQVDPSPRVQLHALGLQQHALQLMRVAGAAGADLAAGVHDPMPRDVAPLREVVQRVTDLPGVAFKSRQCSDLPVGGHASGRDLADPAPDELVAFQGRAL